MKIYLGTDHAGFELKEKLKPFFFFFGHEVEDLGAFGFDENDDYPDFITPVAKAVSDSPDSFGIIFGKSGQGEAMVANRHAGIRAGVFYGGNIELVKLLREHNNSNILSLGAGFISEDEAKEALKIWLETSFSGDERHTRRIAKF